MLKEGTFGQQSDSRYMLWNPRVKVLHNYFYLPLKDIEGDSLFNSFKYCF